MTKIFYLFLLFSIVFKGYAQTKKDLINGNWYFEMLHNDLGNCNFYMEFKITSDSSFEAHTRKNVDKEILGNLKSYLVRNLAGMFKGGSLARVVKGKYYLKNDTLKLSGVFTNPLANSYFEALIINTKMDAKLLNGKQQKVANLSGDKKINKQPLHNYPEIVSKAMTISEEKIYSSSIPKSSDWKKFKSKTLNFSKHAQDDLEMIFGFFYFKRKIKISHFAFLKMPDANSEMVAKRKERFTSLSEKSKSTVLLSITSLSGSSEEIDSVFKVIIERKYENLIIDFRGNAGGSVEAGLPIVKNLIEKPIYGGIFLTRKWFDKNNYVPKINEYKNFDFFSESNFNAIIEGIHNKEGLCLKVEPNAIRFTGKVFILTDKATASTCEPIVYGLKQIGRALIVGEKTAGAMLNGERFEVQDAYKILLPTADFYTSDGHRLDGIGVMPNYVTKSNEAYDFVIANLIK